MDSLVAANVAHTTTSVAFVRKLSQCPHVILGCAPGAPFPLFRMLASDSSSEYAAQCGRGKASNDALDQLGIRGQILRRKRRALTLSFNSICCVHFLAMHAPIHLEIVAPTGYQWPSVRPSKQRHSRCSRVQ